MDNRKNPVLTIFVIVAVPLLTSNRCDRSGDSLTNFNDTVDYNTTAITEKELCQAIQIDPTVESSSGKFCVKQNDTSISGATLSSVQKGLATEERKSNCISFLAPTCTKIQEHTSLPASVCIAQAVKETGWCRSKVLSKSNAFFGESCWSYGEVKVTKIVLSKNPLLEKTVKTKCGHKRPEGDYYKSFEKVEDSMYKYAHNILINPKTEQYYDSLRKTVKKSKDMGRVAPWSKVIKGLGAYAASGRSYYRSLAKIISQNKLDRFDHLSTCKGSRVGENADTEVKNCNNIDNTSKNLSIENLNATPKGAEVKNEKIKAK
jgi:flagellum-specific peptidoglycan hydrolase FlgJ